MFLIQSGTVTTSDVLSENVDIIYFLIFLSSELYFLVTARLVVFLLKETAQFIAWLHSKKGEFIDKLSACSIELQNL